MIRGYIFNKTFLNEVKRDELETNVSSVFKIYCEGDYRSFQTDSFNLDIYGDSTAIVTLKRMKWGIYDLITCSSKWKDLIISHTGLFGTDLNRGEDLALYLTDSGIDLSLSGNSLLKGLCYVPGGIIKSASIEGHPFIYDKITEGQIKKSDKSLPEIDTEIPKSILSFFQYNYADYPLSGVKSNNTNFLENSFKNKTLPYYEETSVSLSGMKINGNIIIASAGTVTIDNSVSLENVIILARNILIDDGFLGSFQGFALETINVGKNVHLKYPSALGIIQDKSRKLSENNQSITLGENSILSGGIIVISNDNNGLVRILQKAVVLGQVYCAGSVDLSGDIFGSLYCNNFKFNASRSSYLNHLLNGDIDFSRLPSAFSGFKVGDQNAKKSLIKWVN
jgi:hypothetical protein